jgi:hypothetical protein
MSVALSRLALWVVARLDGAGTRDALIGDLLEEIERGRPRVWVYEQLVGACAFVLAGCVRRHLRLTPPVVALSLAAVLVVSGLWVPIRNVLATWLTCYYAAGTVSLFAHMLSASTGSPPRAIVDETDQPDAS